MIEEKNHFVSFMLIIKKDVLLDMLVGIHFALLFSISLNNFLISLAYLTYLTCKLLFHFIDTRFFTTLSKLLYKKPDDENNKMWVTLSFKVILYFKLNFRGI